jgi:PAS domain S-box-containing protein
LRMILAGASLKEVLTSVARVVESHREGMLCSVWLLDQDRVHMRAIAAPTLPESYVAALDGFVVGPQGGSCGAAVNQRKPVFVSDVLTDPILEQVRDIIAAHGIRACWSAPIMSHQGEILGTFAFYFRSVRSPSPRDIHLIENATNIAGIAIERKKAEENLRRSEWSLLEAQRLGHSGSWSLDVSSGMVTTSPEMLRSFDVKPGDDCSSPDFWFNRIHPEDRKRVRDLFERCVMEKTDYEAHYRLLLPDGTIKYQHSIGRPIVNEKGDLVEFVGTAIDVTEQAQARIELEKAFEEIKQRTEAARRSERELRDVVNTVPANVWSTSPEGAVDFVNDRCLQFTGLALDEIFGWKWEPVLHPDDRTRVVADWHTAVKNERAMESEARVRRADGEYCWWFIRNVPLRDETGKLVRWYGTGIDIHDRKQAEEALQRSEGYLAEAQKLTRTGSWAAHVHQMENLYWTNVYWSEELFRIFGFDPNPTPPSEVEIVGRLHPEDVLHNKPLVDQAIRGRSDFEVDYRLLLPNGAAKYIHVVGHPVVNASGDVIEIVGTAMDVTEQHEARAALQTAFEQIKAEETELRQMTDAIASYIYVLRPDGTALYANQTLLDYTGLTLEDVQREDQRARVFHPEDLERLREERHEALARGKPFELEQRALGKDGNYRWFLVRFNPLRDDHGNIIRWYATGTDIEDRKRAEERMRNENLALREQIDHAFMFEEIVGASSALHTVLSSIVKVAPTDSTVLITGETGTGKELIARAIHKHSKRSGQAFISVNCASIPPSLIASELFGHEKGAFTGAVQRRQGRFELAHSGSIFLDEVGELPAETQIALLRVLQERQFERVGGNRIIPTDVRVIAATNRDLTAAIAAGTFRADLFYRLNVFPIEVPPLRKRKEDIPMLVEYFVKRYAEKMGKQIRKIDKNTLELCQSYPWPGNIRELQNIVERSVILSSGDTFWIEKAWLASEEAARQELPGPLPDTLQNQERKIIETALTESKGKVAGPEGAAAKLGIPRSTLDTKIKQLNIKKHKFIAEQ